MNQDFIDPVAKFEQSVSIEFREFFYFLFVSIPPSVSQIRKALFLQKTRYITKQQTNRSRLSSLLHFTLFHNRTPDNSI